MKFKNSQGQEVELTVYEASVLNGQGNKHTLVEEPKPIKQPEVSKKKTPKVKTNDAE